MNTESTPFVSICCITYNHAAYIKQCLDGFLMQKTDFPFEILVFDDASKDGTAAIIREYAEKDERFITFLQDENQWRKGKFGLIEWLFPGVKGKYISLCEGDDYWTDPLKLQKQVEFLENHPDYSICYHRVMELQDGILKPESLNKGEVQATYTLKELSHQNLIHTPSVIFRNHFNGKLPAWFSSLPIGDYPLHIYNASQGKIFYMPDLMAVYRIHNGGIWSKKEQIEKYHKLITMLVVLLRQMPLPVFVKDTFKARVNAYTHFLLTDLWRTGNKAIFVNLFVKYLFQNPLTTFLWLKIRVRHKFSMHF